MAETLYYAKPTNLPCRVKREKARAQYANFRFAMFKERILII